jgi:NitT/TauT family transport system substrate-binding protein
VGLLLAGLVGCTPAATAPAKPATNPPAASAPTASAPAAAAPAAAQAAASRPPATLKLATLRPAADAGIFIAIERGYFAEEGLELEMAQVDVGAQTIAFLASGQIDVGGGGQSPALINAVQRGINVKGVADKASFPPGFGSTAILVRQDLADAGVIRDYPDLRGHTIATPAVGSTAHMLVMKALERGGLRHTDVEHVNLPFPDQPQALANRNIDLGAAAEPFITFAVEQGIATRWKGADEVYPGQQGALLMYGPNLLQNQPELGRAFMVAYLRGVRDYNDATRKGINRPEIFAMLAKNLTVKDVALWERMVPTGLNPDGRINVDTIREDIERWIDLGMLKPEDRIDPGVVVDHEFVDFAVSRLGPYQP